MITTQTHGDTDRDSRPRASHDGNASVIGLLRTLRDETTHLIRKEVDLAKAELSDKVTSSIYDTVTLIAGGLVALLGALFVLHAMSQGLMVGLIALGLGPEIAVWLAPLIVGLVIGAIGLIALAAAQARLKNRKYYPEETTQSMKEHKQWIEQKAT